MRFNVARTLGKMNDLITKKNAQNCVRPALGKFLKIFVDEILPDDRGESELSFNIKFLSNRLMNFSKNRLLFEI